MKHFLLWLFPVFQLELDALRSANTTVTLHNAELLDRLAGTRADRSIAKQLQASMERNSRMQARLRMLIDRCNGHQPTYETYDAVYDIEIILKDEEPTWPPA